MNPLERFILWFVFIVIGGEIILVASVASEVHRRYESVMARFHKIESIIDRLPIPNPINPLPRPWKPFGEDGETSICDPVQVEFPLVPVPDVEQ